MGAEKISSGSLVTVDSAGKFFATLLIPVTAPYLAPGAQTVLVTDSAGKSASATLTIPTPTHPGPHHKPGGHHSHRHRH